MIRFLGTLAVAISLAGGAAFAQVQEFEGYWQSLSQAVKANNFQGVRRLVEQDRRSAERAFFQAADHYVSLGLKGDIEGEKHRLDILRNLGNAFVSIDNNDDYSKYTQFLQRLNLIKKDQWSSTYGDYVDFILAYAGVSAQEKGKRSEDDAKAALELAEDPIRGWEDLGDFYLQGQALRSKALLQAWAGDLDGSKRSLELARACFETFGSSAGVDLINRSLTEVAVELANKEKEDRRVEAEEDAKGVEQPGEKPWTDIQMAYRKDARGLGPLVHPYSVDEYLLWNRVLLIKDEPKNFSDEYERSPGRFSAYYTETFGRGPSANSLLYPLTFQQVDNRLTLDLNSDGRVQGPERLKATSSPKVFEFEDLPAKSGGTFDYAVELVDIGQETWFGQANSVFANEGDKAVAFRRSCHMEGSLEGRDLILVDDNSNGAYNDLGGDVLYVKGGEPSFFGKMMHLAGEIYEVRIPDALGKGHEQPFKTFAGGGRNPRRTDPAIGIALDTGGAADAVGLVVDAQARQVSGANAFEHLLDHRLLAQAIRVGCVNQVHDQARAQGFFQGGAKGGNQFMRQVADKADGVADQQRSDPIAGQASDRRIEGRKQLIAGDHLGPGDPIEQRGLAGIGVANQRHQWHLAARPSPPSLLAASLDPAQARAQVTNALSQ